MYRKFLILVCTLSVALLSSCQDVVDLEVPDSPPEIVINGVISDQKPAQVNLSTTDAFFENNEVPKISDAQVSLFKNNALVEVLSAQPEEPGLYLGTQLGQIGGSYHLEVIIPEGYPGRVSGTFLTQPELLKPVSTLDSIAIRPLDRTTSPPAFFNPGDYALIFFRERPGQGDIFRLRRWLNDSLFARDLITIEDQGFDGQYIGDTIPPIAIFGPFEDLIDPGQTTPDTFKVRFESISTNYADFLQLIDEQTSVGSPFDAPPALILGNVYRQGNPNDYAFGYFHASAYSQKSVIRQP
jgi:hypothetical protein